MGGGPGQAACEGSEPSLVLSCAGHCENKPGDNPVVWDWAVGRVSGVTLELILQRTRDSKTEKGGLPAGEERPERTVCR